MARSIYFAASRWQAEQLLLSAGTQPVPRTNVNVYII
jgi:hypothetical protein